MIGLIRQVVYFAEAAKFADLHWANHHTLGHKQFEGYQC
jgi:hypothetical protein